MDCVLQCLTRLHEAGQGAVHRNVPQAVSTEQAPAVVPFDQNDHCR